MHKKFPIKDLAPLIVQSVESGGRFKIYPRGTSMLPLIKEGHTAVSLVKANAVSKGDIVLYQRANGQYVLHRCVKIKGDEYLMCGDNQFVFEHGITRDMIVATIDGYYPGEEFVSISDARYRRYVRHLPLRRCRKRLKYYLWAIKRRIFKK